MTNKEYYYFSSDLSLEMYEKIKKSSQVAIDIETTGLNWEKEHIILIQICNGKDLPVLMKIESKIPRNLLSVIETKNIKKIFHFASFDLKFISKTWNVEPKNISCTKIAAKILNHDIKRDKTFFSLINLLDFYLGIKISKKQQQSDWSLEKLSHDQLTYAANDVKYLIDLHNHLISLLKSRELLNFTEKCFKHIPTRIKLDLMKMQDIYEY